MSFRKMFFFRKKDKTAKNHDKDELEIKPPHDTPIQPSSGATAIGAIEEPKPKSSETEKSQAMKRTVSLKHNRRQSLDPKKQARRAKRAQSVLLTPKMLEEAATDDQKMDNDDLVGKSTASAASTPTALDTLTTSVSVSQLEQPFRSSRSSTRLGSRTSTSRSSKSMSSASTSSGSKITRGTPVPPGTPSSSSSSSASSSTIASASSSSSKTSKSSSKSSSKGSEKSGGESRKGRKGSHHKRPLTTSITEPQVITSAGSMVDEGEGDGHNGNTNSIRDTYPFRRADSKSMQLMRTPSARLTSKSQTRLISLLYRPEGPRYLALICQVIQRKHYVFWVTALLELYCKEPQYVWYLLRILLRRECETLQCDDIDATNTIFRSTTLFTTLLAMSSERFAHSYLLSTVAFYVGSLVLDHHQLGGPDLHNKYFEPLFMTNLLKSMPKMPADLRNVYALLATEVRARLPECEQNAVASMFFLRLICPSLLTPADRQLWNSPLTPAVKSALMLSSKTLQSRSIAITNTPTSTTTSTTTTSTTTTAIIDPIEQQQQQAPRDDIKDYHSDGTLPHDLAASSSSTSSKDSSCLQPSAIYAPVTTTGPGISQSLTSPLTISACRAQPPLTQNATPRQPSSPTTAATTPSSNPPRPDLADGVSQQLKLFITELVDFEVTEEVPAPVNKNLADVFHLTQFHEFCSLLSEYYLLVRPWIDKYPDSSITNSVGTETLASFDEVLNLQLVQ